MCLKRWDSDSDISISWNSADRFHQNLSFKFSWRKWSKEESTRTKIRTLTRHLGKVWWGEESLKLGIYRLFQRYIDGWAQKYYDRFSHKLCRTHPIEPSDWPGIFRAHFFLFHHLSSPFHDSCEYAEKLFWAENFFFVKSNLKHLFTFLGSKDRALFAKSAPELWDLGMG